MELLLDRKLEGLIIEKLKSIRSVPNTELISIRKDRLLVDSVYIGILDLKSYFEIAREFMIVGFEKKKETLQHEDGTKYYMFDDAIISMCDVKKKVSYENLVWNKLKDNKQYISDLLLREREYSRSVEQHIVICHMHLHNGDFDKIDAKNLLDLASRYSSIVLKHLIPADPSVFSLILDTNKGDEQKSARDHSILLNSFGCTSINHIFSLAISAICSNYLEYGIMDLDHFKKNYAYFFLDNNGISPYETESRLNAVISSHLKQNDNNLARIILGKQELLETMRNNRWERAATQRRLVSEYVSQSGIDKDIFSDLCTLLGAATEWNEKARIYRSELFNTCRLMIQHYGLSLQESGIEEIYNAQHKTIPAKR